MTNNANNNTHHKDLLKALIFITGAAVAFYSATLTYQFMAGLSPTLGSIGILFEVVKFFLPMIALYAFKTGAVLRGYLLSAIGLMLIAMSFTASFIAVDNGFDNDRKQSAEFIALNQKIEILKSQAYELRKQSNALPFDYITKRSQLNDQAVSIENNMASLIGDRASLKTDSVADKFGKYIAIAAAVIIELLTVSTTIAISLLSSSKTTQDNSVRTTLNQPNTGEDTHIKANTLIKRIETEPRQVTILAKTSVEDEIKQAVKARAFDRPSVAAIAKVFKVSRNLINDCLNDLELDGTLIKSGNGRAYA